MKIKCIITDDEPFARKGLKGYVERIDFLELVGMAENVMELNALLKAQTVDLIFLDIQMPQISGLDFLKSLKNPPLVVITTAFSEYALEGYELDVLDFLLKPISFDRFLKAGMKAKDFLEMKVSQAEKHPEFFFLKCGHRLEKILLEEILWIESLQNYVKVCTKKETYTAHLPLKKVSEFLPDSRFVQSHKSFLVAIDKIEAVDGNQFIVAGTEIPISKYLKDSVLEKVVNSRLLKR